MHHHDLSCHFMVSGVFSIRCSVFLQGTFVPDAEEAEERPKGALQDPTISLATPGKFFGVKGFGFTKVQPLFSHPGAA